jgi:hypothetical protein
VKWDLVILQKKFLVEYLFFATRKYVFSGHHTQAPQTIQSTTSHHRLTPYTNGFNIPQIRLLCSKLKRKTQESSHAENISISNPGIKETKEVGSDFKREGSAWKGMCWTWRRRRTGSRWWTPWRRARRLRRKPAQGVDQAPQVSQAPQADPSSAPRAGARRPPPPPGPAPPRPAPAAALPRGAPPAG